MADGMRRSVVSPPIIIQLKTAATGEVGPSGLYLHVGHEFVLSAAKMKNTTAC